MRVLVFGASGMIGSAMFRVLSEKKEWEVRGTLRSNAWKRFFPETLAGKLIPDVDVERHDALVRVFAQVQPDVVVNCVGLTKHHSEAEDPLLSIPLNALLPHRLADLCAATGSRLVHVSTDCVFSGTRGGYVEDDAPDAVDVYGKSKHLGEVADTHAITLRTSTIGHELQSAYGLLEWFLSQQGSCKGFSRAIFSGLPNVVFAQVVRDVVIPRPELAGLYHVGAQPIGKYDLLQLIARTYNKSINIERDDKFIIDRSLNTQRFQKATGYVAPGWAELIGTMHSFT
ncbi:dTDP-4-dehydrorhamnose reductase family protein [Polaromonas sp.]|jgi:dTDP-4-dehydrorhamnose reductase|uniref:dTDP-4-dehydrorhamnose reductase family protein n=1 Tax=Polaromonas sp. TaxID=1869339 RepID=UPI0037C4FFA0